LRSPPLFLSQTLDPVARPAAVVSDCEHMDLVVHDEIRNVVGEAVNSASPNDESFNLGHRRARLRPASDRVDPVLNCR
jgi:hypothetical protein